MKKLKRFTAVFIAFALVFGVFAPFTAIADEITVSIDGEIVEFEGQGPAIVDGRTLVPVRGVFEALGFDVEWFQEPGTATLDRDDLAVRITVGVSFFLLNDAQHPLEVPAQIIEGRTMLPIRAVLESVGYYVGWDAATRTVLVSTNPIEDVQPEPVQEPAGETIEGITAEGRRLTEQFLLQYPSIFSLGVLTDDGMLSFGWSEDVDENPLVYIVYGHAAQNNWDAGRVYFADGTLVPTTARFINNTLLAVNFALYDFNNNGIPEILITYTAETFGGIVIYSYFDGEFQAVGTVSSAVEFFRNAEGQVIILAHNHDMAMFYRIDTTPAGEMFAVLVYDWDSPIWDWDNMHLDWWSHHEWPHGDLTPIKPLETLHEIISSTVRRQLGLD